MKVASFEEKGVWIDPLRDRRPMTEDWVLVTVDVGHSGRVVIDACYRPKTGWNTNSTVLAWQPMPEPFNPVEEAER